ncbi:MAG: SDR family NAD(P)-dependent oxidoreductase, partial [Actinobacteria bacterium]|nr:SDR family NAD(P)-dependent oxidoreductase [Actinomycetota bacterium]
MKLPYLHDEMDARGKRVLITGASGTFGAAIAEAFVARGAEVVGLDLHPQPADSIEVIACDITDNDSV